VRGGAIQPYYRPKALRVAVLRKLKVVESSDAVWLGLSCGSQYTELSKLMRGVRFTRIVSFASDLVNYASLQQGRGYRSDSTYCDGYSVIYVMQPYK
jgi:hypothetical protein